jgi:hypothetical protein
MQVGCVIYYLLILCFLTGCGPSSLEDFQEEGEGFSRSLVKELRTIQNRKDLLESAPKLKKRFDGLVDLMIRAREFKEKHPFLESNELIKMNHDLSDQLRIELNRIYAIEGGRELIEKCQEEGLNRLDAFERRLHKMEK